VQYASQVDDSDPRAVEHEIHGAVTRVATTDLGEHRGRNANECTLVVRDMENGSGTVSQGTAKRGARKRVDRLGIQYQRFGQAALAVANSLSTTKSPA
jgi:hypothetical protein